MLNTFAVISNGRYHPKAPAISRGGFGMTLIQILLSPFHLPIPPHKYVFLLSFR